MIDSRDFTEQYRIIYRDLYRFALCMMRHPQDAEDAVSEAVLSAYEHIYQLRTEEAFRSWMFQILTNVCKKKLKENTRTEVELMEEHASKESDAGMKEDVRRALLILSEEERLVVCLSVFSGYNSAEIGQMLKLNASTVRSKRRRALEKMSWLLKE